MINPRMLLFIGLWVAILPYLGFPLFIKNILFLLTGLLIMYLAFVLYRSLKDKGQKDVETFSESNNFN
jgi:hypothetical protein